MKSFRSFRFLHSLPISGAPAALFLALAPLLACTSGDPLGGNRDAGADAPTPSPEAGAGSDAGDAGPTCNNGGATSALPAKLVCSTPTLDQGNPPPSTWSGVDAYCPTVGASLLSAPCDGYLAMSGPYANSADGQQVVLYDATTLKLVATLYGQNDQFWSCAGPAGLAIDTAGCFHPDDFGFCAYGPSSTALTRCADAGTVVDAGPIDAAADH